MKKAIADGQTVVLFVDECHLRHNQSCGYVWSLRGQRVSVPMFNHAQSQTYYGALDLLTRRFYLRACGVADSENTVDFLCFLLENFPDAQRLVVIWDGARFHTGTVVSAFLTELNDGLLPSQWLLECVRLAPNAPAQNPVEDCWLKAKNFVRRHVQAQFGFKHICQLFEQAFRLLSFEFNKLDWCF
jgi:transposase